MKPCSKNRELIAWLALGALDNRQERQLRAHLETCERCRRYLEEISNVTEKLTAAEIRLDIQTSETFHQKVARRLRAEETSSTGKTVWAHLRSTWLKWQNRKERLLTPALSSAEEEREKTSVRFGSWLGGKLALPLIGATIMLIAASFLFVRRPDVRVPAPIVSQAVSNPNKKADLDPTVSNYQKVANRSLDKLDELLTRQGNRNPSPVVIYTASALARENALD